MSMAMKYAMHKKKMAMGGYAKGGMCAEGCNMFHEHRYADGGDVDDAYVEASPSPSPSPSPAPKPVIDPKKGKIFSTAFKTYSKGGAVTEDDRMLNRHGEDEVSSRGMDDDNEAPEMHNYAHPVENQDHDATALDMVGRIMKQREMHYSKGGQVANDTGNGQEADKEPNQFDDLVLRDDDMEDADYTGANSGDERGDAGEDKRRMDVISQIMKSRRKKDRLPNPR